MQYPIHTAYFNDIVVGGVCCRVETEAMVKKLYIMTLGCLAAYRRLGVGMHSCRVFIDPCPFMHGSISQLVKLQD